MGETISTPGKTIEAKTPWTPEEAADLLINSFKFSQGSADFQVRLFEMLAKKFPTRLLPPQETSGGIIRLAKPMAEKIVLGKTSPHTKKNTAGELMNTGNLPFNLKTELNNWYLVSREEKRDALPSIEKLRKTIILFTIERDKYFAEGKSLSGVQRDKSFFRDYVVKQDPISSPEFDAIFKDLHNFLAAKGVNLNGTLEEIEEQVKKIEE